VEAGIGLSSAEPGGTAILRLKTIFGATLQSRNFAPQATAHMTTDLLLRLCLRLRARNFAQQASALFPARHGFASHAPARDARELSVSRVIQGMKETLCVA